MKETLKEDLLNCKCVGNTLYLPTDHLNDYKELKKTLMNACGKYSSNSFEFPYPSKSIIDILLSGKNINFKKEFQFFATPSSVAFELCDHIFFNPNFSKSINVLEPSAGHGALIDELLTRSSMKLPLKNIDLVELSELNLQILNDKYGDCEYINIIHSDFMQFDSGKKYDLIIANPPFTKNQDIDHIMRMYDLLDVGGQLVSISSTSWLNGGQKKQVEFKEWLDSVVCGHYKELDKGLFKESGTNVSTMLVSIIKE